MLESSMALTQLADSMVQGLTVSVLPSPEQSGHGSLVGQAEFSGISPK